MAYNLEKANRGNGDWIIGDCPYRAIPCGNPVCVDESMRSGEIFQEGNSFAEISSKYALENAIKKAKKCDEHGIMCPIGMTLEKRLHLISILHHGFRPKEKK